MFLLIEGYPYDLSHEAREGLTLRELLEGVVSFPLLEKEVRFGYVGYCYSKRANDMVFFLPKVVLTGGEDTIFDASPKNILDFDNPILSDEMREKWDREQYKEFLSNLSVWIYRTISVYKKRYNENILESGELQTFGGGRKTKFNTLLDVIIALQEFNRSNQEFFTFIVKNQHSGYNKINWGKTISHSQAIVQDGRPVYLKPVNKKKMVNFDEELLVIYFSILNYIHEEHGFGFGININYELIKPKVLKAKYIDKKYGRLRLRQIKYKYFSDKALRIWDLCYAFFDRGYAIAMKENYNDYLLAKDFDRVFEKMIDCLISGDDKVPEPLKAQKDGKLVDHLFIGQGLIEQTADTKGLTYYIGDSKYYKRGEDLQVHLGDTSIYKQYTYARNVVQWNMNLFLGVEDKRKYDAQPQLLDELTEGYNPIPNFFISAHIPEKTDEKDRKVLSFTDDNLTPQDGNIQLNRQFENRLFDRDTLLLCHYDVNFLFIVSLYGRDNKAKQAAWREKVRENFRQKIQETLDELYVFNVLYPKKGKNCHRFIKDNFHQLNGKVYRPKPDSNYLILATMRKEAKARLDKNKRLTRFDEAIQKGDDLMKQIDEYFDKQDFCLSKNESVDAEMLKNAGSLEAMDFALNTDALVLVGVVKNAEHWDWIQKGYYNIRIITPKADRHGAVLPTKQLMMVEKLLLYSSAEISDMPSACMFDLADMKAIPMIYDFSEMNNAGYPFENRLECLYNRYLVYEIDIDSFGLNSSVNHDALLRWVKWRHEGEQDESMRFDGAPIVGTLDELKDWGIFA